MATPAVPQFSAFLALRLVQGLGGGIMLVSMVFIARQLADRQRETGLGIWRAALLAGTVAGPPIGGYLASLLGWQAIFWVTGLAGAATLGWAAVTLTELPRQRRRRFDWVGATAFTVSFSALVVGLAAAGFLRTMGGGATTGPVAALSSLAPVFLGIFVVGLAVLVINQRVNAQPLFASSLWRNRQFLLGNAGTFLVCVGMFSAMMFTSLMLRNVFDLPAVQASNALLLMTVGAVVFGVWGGALAGRFGPGLPWASGFVLTAATFVALAVLVSPVASAVWLFVLAPLSGAGQGLPLGPTASVALRDVPDEDTAEATGWFDFSHNIGRAVAIGGLGALFVPGDAASYTLIFWVSATLTALGAALVLGIKRPASATQAQPAAAT
ncbi:MULTISPECIES: MFS transporter [Prauserella]|uniref:MFS transporter n=1 Tax=Prauserella TaxID=142577 RepID=UPI001E4131BD|nr:MULTISPECIES: MFS transporter [Prauserella]